MGKLSNRLIHLTNDAVQKKSEDYGKFENGNKIAYHDFQKYLDANFPKLNIDFYRDILPQIAKLVTDTFRAAYTKIDPYKRMNCFELYGFDFMLDDEFKVYLIEANTNPCLTTPCPLLTRIISNLLDSTFRIALDPLFHPHDFSQAKRSNANDILNEVKFYLVFDERVDGPFLKELL